MRTETLGESPQRRTEHSAIRKMANPWQIVERQPLRLASDTKGPVQTCYLRNMMAHRSMAPAWDKSMHRQIDVQAFVFLTFCVKDKGKDKYKNGGDGDGDGNTSITLKNVLPKRKAPETPDTAETPKKAKKAKARKGKANPRSSFLLTHNASLGRSKTVLSMNFHSNGL
ncbi:hypothetical protein N7455_006254 [Penicillium solitum]|uniref:uncharacterized protein n=1 Tax=Penicillium solitum TaxID=60172 RepID=UPI0032C4A8E0|nr:hypothetical protein N7455_006254 [Penicillium solitum]